MKVVYECCCGVDVHLKQVVACLLKGSPPQRQKEIRTFGTTTTELGIGQRFDQKTATSVNVMVNSLKVRTVLP
jgi:hypothetical protein